MKESLGDKYSNVVENLLLLPQATIPVCVVRMRVCKYLFVCICMCVRMCAYECTYVCVYSQPQLKKGILTPPQHCLK